MMNASKIALFRLSLLFLTLANLTHMNAQETAWNKLTELEKRIILRKGTEAPYTGKYWDSKAAGVYLCKQCNTPLYKSDTKFDSHCGWPSFDDEIDGTVTRVPDADGRRTEIICTNCKGHLGHVFLGEGFTPKNTRHCVNSVSLKFVPKEEWNLAKNKKAVAIFASGCFWGTEYYFQKAKGVISTTVGYVGGHIENPDYRQVSSKKSGHYEAVKVVYDPTETSYEEMVKLFFETHNPEQKNGQGPDIGPQYRSAIFIANEMEKETAQKLIQILTDKGMDIATTVLDASQFWDAEDYHQDYYKKKGSTPYCHFYQKKFD